MQIEEAKEVVQLASGFLEAQERSAQNIRLEQIEEQSKGGSDAWSVVLSFRDPDNALSAFSGNTPRVYKEIIVDAGAKR